MTETQTDRQDGDGLRACPCCNGPSEASTAFDGSIYEGHVIICANGKCGCQSGVFPTPAMARKAWNTRPQPTRDAAEGARDLCIDCDGSGKYPSGNSCKSCAGTGRVCCGDGIKSATPQPAPDTMREALNVTELPQAKAQKIVDVMNALATPLVRGDLELWRERWHGSDPQRGWSIMQGRDVVVYIGGDEALSQAVTAIVMAHNAALPVQPGAVEREQALRDEIFCLREVVRGVRILDHAGRFKEYDGEPWLRRVRNIGLDHDPVEFNRQAPQSSREG